MTSAEIVVGFVQGRPVLEVAVRRHATDPFHAPESVAALIRSEIIDAFDDVTDEERASLDRMRGNGAVVWNDVAKAFGWRPAT